MLLNLHDYIDRIYKEIKENTKNKPERTTCKRNDVKKALIDLERSWGRCIRKGWQVNSPIMFKPYTNKYAQEVLKKMYKEQNILWKQKVKYRYAKKKINETNI
jgi:hypothetical protein